MFLSFAVAGFGMTLNCCYQGFSGTIAVRCNVTYYALCLTTCEILFSIFVCSIPRVEVQQRRRRHTIKATVLSDANIDIVMKQQNRSADIRVGTEEAVTGALSRSVSRHLRTLNVTKLTQRFPVLFDGGLFAQSH